MKTIKLPYGLEFSFKFDKESLFGFGLVLNPFVKKVIDNPIKEFIFGVSLIGFQCSLEIVLPPKNIVKVQGKIINNKQVEIKQSNKQGLPAYYDLVFPIERGRLVYWYNDIDNIMPVKIICLLPDEKVYIRTEDNFYYVTPRRNLCYCNHKTEIYPIVTGYINENKFVVL